MILTTSNNNKNIRFGHGTIRITSAYIAEKGILALTPHDYRPIGSSAPFDGTANEKIEEIKTSEIVMSFENISSLEVLILKLQEVRAMMLGANLDQVEKWKQTHDITTLYHANPFIDLEPKEDLE